MRSSSESHRPTTLRRVIPPLRYSVIFIVRSKNFRAMLPLLGLSSSLPWSFPDCGCGKTMLLGGSFQKNTSFKYPDHQRKECWDFLRRCRDGPSHWWEPPDLSGGAGLQSGENARSRSMGFSPGNSNLNYQ